MRVTARKGPPHRETHKVPVVLEVWLSPEEALDLDLSAESLTAAVSACINEHLLHRHRATRNIKQSSK